VIANPTELIIARAALIHERYEASSDPVIRAFALRRSRSCGLFFRIWSMS
jgi:hypothetical protein